MVQTVDIIKALITQKLKLFLEVEADGVASGANWVVQVCNTLWLRAGKTFDFDGHRFNLLVDNLTGIEFRPIVRFYKSCEELCNFQ